MIPFRKIARFSARLFKIRQDHHTIDTQIDESMDLMDKMGMWEHEDMVRQELHATRWYWNLKRSRRNQEEESDGT